MSDLGRCETWAFDKLRPAYSIKVQKCRLLANMLLGYKYYSFDFLTN